MQDFLVWSVAKVHVFQADSFIYARNSLAIRNRVFFFLLFNRLKPSGTGQGELEHGVDGSYLSQRLEVSPGIFSKSHDQTQTSCLADLLGHNHVSASGDHDREVQEGEAGN